LLWCIDFAGVNLTFAGMDIGATNFSFRPELVKQGPPSWDFMWGELKDREDVELNIQYSIGTNWYGHAVTLTSLKFDDLNNPTKNGHWDPGEARMIDYLDPNNNTNVIWANLVETNGFLGFKWDNGINDAQNVWIVGAFAESIPEPATVAVLSLGSAVLLLDIRRRRRSRP